MPPLAKRRPPPDSSPQEGAADIAENRRIQLEAIAAGDRNALATLVLELGDLVYGTVLRLTASRADAEDLTQEVFIRLAQTVAGFTGTTDQFPAWLRRIAVRAALMQLRSGRRRREVDVDAIATLVSRSDDVLARVTLETALAQLSDEHRAVFLLKEV